MKRITTYAEFQALKAIYKEAKVVSVSDHGALIFIRKWHNMLTVSYSVNGKSINVEELKTLQITRKDYIDYVEEIKRKARATINNSKKG